MEKQPITRQELEMAIDDYVAAMLTQRQSLIQNSGRFLVEKLDMLFAVKQSKPIKNK